MNQAKREFQSRKTYAQGIIGGAIKGALVGALSGLKVGPGGIGFDAEQAKRGAAVGAGVGAVGGGVYAHQKVQERRAYMNQAISLENSIKQTRETRQLAGSFNNTLAAEVRKMKQGDAQIAGTVRDAQSVLNSVNRELADQCRRLAAAQSASSSEKARLRSEINQLESVKTGLINTINRANQKNAKPDLTSN